MNSRLALFRMQSNIEFYENGGLSKKKTKYKRWDAIWTRTNTNIKANYDSLSNSLHEWIDQAPKIKLLYAGYSIKINPYVRCQYGLKGFENSIMYLDDQEKINIDACPNDDRVNLDDNREEYLNLSVSEFDKNFEDFDFERKSSFATKCTNDDDIWHKSYHTVINELFNIDPYRNI